ncbi:MAG TPA: HAD family phosphatase [Candidatus Saccharimonadales bacterium]|nr:HAD family phosphatase [Candidatus Saccharimonadales bacterium]
MIKAIIFDCFGVLTQDGWKAFVEGLDTEEAKAAARELNRQYDASLISLERFLEGIKKVTGRDYDIIKSARSSEDAKNTQLINYIKLLKEKNYKLGILSNVATNWVRDYLLTAEEQGLFDAMVFSFEEGFTKPDPRIYEMVLKQLGAQPEEAVFIDDTERYCQAAQEIGIRAIWYKDFSQMKKELEALLTVSNN